MASRKRIFVSFAIEDRTSRDLLKGQSLHTDSPFEYVDMSAKQPWDAEWKTRCRTRIRSSDGVIALLSKNTLTANGARWEINCAGEEGKKILGVYIYKSDHSSPPEMEGKKKIAWTWDGIKTFINSL